MIDAATLETIAGEVAKLGLSEQSLAELRTRHREIHFTYCMDDDVGLRTPYLSGANFNIYLVDGREHCLRFTDELVYATGLVVAEVIDDD
jgi:hypothetical protein